MQFNGFWQVGMTGSQNPGSLSWQDKVKEGLGGFAKLLPYQFFKHGGGGNAKKMKNGCAGFAQDWVG